MTKRSNPADLAFEDYLRKNKLPYVAVREELRPLYKTKTIKNLDFIVTAPQKEHALIDVKGKKFIPGQKGASRWENWVMAGDIDALLFWEKCFGRAFLGLLVFVYELPKGSIPLGFKDVHKFGDVSFGIVACTAREYAAVMKVRSMRWDTRSVPVRLFKKIIKPISDFI